VEEDLEEDLDNLKEEEEEVEEVREWPMAAAGA
jgi:hypothetical protein